MDTRKLILHIDGDSGVQSRIELEDFGTTHYIDGDTDMVAELVKRWNMHNDLVTALADMVSTAKEVEGMMDGDKDKQEAWTEELGRLYVALDAAKALLATLNTH